LAETRVSERNVERIARVSAEPRRDEIHNQIGASSAPCPCIALDQGEKLSAAILSHASRRWRRRVG
jgi:hypothetical protein